MKNVALNFPHHFYHFGSLATGNAFCAEGKWWTKVIALQVLFGEPAVNACVVFYRFLVRNTKYELWEVSFFAVLSKLTKGQLQMFRKKCFCWASVRSITFFEMFWKAMCFRCRSYTVCLLAALLLCPCTIHKCSPPMHVNIHKPWFHQVGMGSAAFSRPELLCTEKVAFIGFQQPITPYFACA